jgi:hypothetical protein
MTADDEVRTAMRAVLRLCVKDEARLQRALTPPAPRLWSILSGQPPT